MCKPLCACREEPPRPLSQPARRLPAPRRPVSFGFVSYQLPHSRVSPSGTAAVAILGARAEGEVGSAAPSGPHTTAARSPQAPVRPRCPPQPPVPPTAASPEPARFWGLRARSPKRLSGPRGLLALIMRRDPSPPLRARRPPPLTRLLRQPPPGPVSRFRPAPPRPPPAFSLVGGKPPPPADWFERVPITARTALGADWLAQTSPG